jgi:hypothetical protein
MQIKKTPRRPGGPRTVAVGSTASTTERQTAECVGAGTVEGGGDGVLTGLAPTQEATTVPVLAVEFDPSCS